MLSMGGHDDDTDDDVDKSLLTVLKYVSSSLSVIGAGSILVRVRTARCHGVARHCLQGATRARTGVGRAGLGLVDGSCGVKEPGTHDTRHDSSALRLTLPTAPQTNTDFAR
mmetsp:Transcript_71931/g.203859  ORF Transcript_71931/g.203859 Transcript_71931/m.203859 type:complete len:111 (-) Transcript_71931:2008-2340(-)